MFALIVMVLVMGGLIAFLCINSSEEVSKVLTVAIAGISGMLALVFAPWQVQLVLLVFILFSTRNIA
jgi:energy-converting hydrogenase Eha subunit E